MKLTHYGLTALAALTLASSAARADDRFTLTPSNSQDVGPFSGGAEVNMNLSSGNVDIKNYGASAFMDFKGEAWSTRFKAGFMRNTTDDIERSRRIDSSLRTGFNVAQNVDFFALGSYMHNRYQGVDMQFMATPGLGIYAVNTEAASVRVEGGIGYMWENYYPTAIGKRDFTVGSAGLGLRLKLSDVADISNDFLYVIPFKDSDDWRIKNVAAITSAVNKNMALKVSYTVEKRNTPVIGREDLDSFTTAALVFKL
jgi:putative salt-induced outer membrane protein YdiY